MKGFLTKAANAGKTYMYAILLALPFLLMDVITRLTICSSDFSLWFVPANLFSISWILLIVGLTCVCRAKVGRIIYWVSFFVTIILFLTQNVYYNLTSFCFSFHLMELADEGSGYVWDTILGSKWQIWVMAAIIMLLALVASMWLPKENTRNKRQLLWVLVGFVAIHSIAYLSLGKSSKTISWKAFRNPRHVYEDFSDANRSISVSGFYEYSVRDFFKTVFDREQPAAAEEIAFLDAVYQGEEAKSNAFTGIFEGKNVIMLQLEGIDSWLLNAQTMPNLYALQQSSIQFTQHFSTYTGGGSTFNSEFAVNTGFIAPITYTENVYSYHKNTFFNTLPKLLRKQGYTANAFHMNEASFYNRDLNYASWGYEHFYGLCDLQQYADLTYALDRELVENDDFYELLFRNNRPFLDYIITYTPHTPFQNDKEVCGFLAKKLYGDHLPQMDEEACAKMMAGETDYMVGLLMQALRDEGLYENTVIVAFADHYLYTLKDKTILDKYKQTDNNLINHTPFFIWSSDIEPTTITEVTMQTNILPTVLNLLGIPYQPANYLCEDALAEDYEGFAFFPDASWYDGSAYVENGQITNGGSCDDLDRKNQKILDIIRKNDLTLKTDYFRDKEIRK